MILTISDKREYMLDKAVHITPNSELYKAYDMKYKRDVAIKKVVIAGDSSKERSENLKKAKKEISTMILVGQTSARLPVIFDDYYDQEENILYIVMQWIPGITLRQKMSEFTYQKDFCSWMIDLLYILESMESNNLYHKDIKPENIMIVNNKDVYLIDYNISMGVANLIEGTENYKAPEMNYDSTTTDRTKSDMFSIGVMMYEYYTKKLPIYMIDYSLFGFGTEKWDSFTSPKEINNEISDKVNLFISKLMAYKPNDRFKSYKDVRRELQQIRKEIGFENGKGRRKNS